MGHCSDIFYITASFLPGGPSDGMISNVIQSEFFATFNWPFGSALAVVFLAKALVFVAFYNKMFNVRLGDEE